ncbi:MAG: hypothetical protein IT269_09480 [Saprospiraceae bacterium]|nr:hypothetical protein [Saprospiraceae bacterium]
MKKWYLLAFLFAISAGAGFAQNINFKVCARHWKTHHPVENLTFRVLYQLPGLPPSMVNIVPPNGASCIDYSIDPLAYPAGTKLIFSATKQDSTLNGINVVDLSDIRGHILGIQPLPTASAVLSGDVNQSAGISTFDMVLVSKAMIFGVSNQDMNWGAVNENVSNFNPWDPSSDEFYFDISELSMFNNDTLFLNAYRKGDVNGDYSFDNAYTGPPTTGMTSMLISDLNLSAGQTATAYLALESAPPVTGIQFALSFDTTKLKIISTSNYLVNQGLSFSFGTPYPGELRVNGLANYEYMISGYNLTHPIIKMEIMALDNIVLKESFHYTHTLPPFLMSKYPNSTYWSLDSTQLIASASIGTKEPLNTLKAGQATPNPFSNECTVLVTLQQAEEVRCEVTDLTGRIVWSSNQFLGSGQQNILIPAEALPAGAMGFYRISTPSGMASGKIQRN